MQAALGDGEVDGRDDRDVHLHGAGRRGVHLHLAVGRPDLRAARADPGERQGVRAHIVGAGLEPHDERGARMHGGEVAHVQGVKDAENIELAFLREVGGVGEEGEGAVHGGKIRHEGGAGERPARTTRARHDSRRSFKHHPRSSAKSGVPQLQVAPGRGVNVVSFTCGTPDDADNADNSRLKRKLSSEVVCRVLSSSVALCRTLVITPRSLSISFPCMSRLRPPLLLASALLLAACAAPAPRHGVSLEPPLPRPSFTLTDTRGQPYDFARETRGRLTFLFFGYTNCPDVCPVHVANVAAVLHKLSFEDQQQATFVFVTVDPARDSLPALRAWLDHFDKSFVGLRGEARRWTA